VEDPTQPKTKESQGNPEKPKHKPVPAETRLYVGHWAAILEDMNKILAQEED